MGDQIGLVGGKRVLQVASCSGSPPFVPKGKWIIQCTQDNFGPKQLSLERESAPCHLMFEIAKQLPKPHESACQLRKVRERAMEGANNGVQFCSRTDEMKDEEDAAQQLGDLMGGKASGGQTGNAGGEAQPE